MRKQKKDIKVWFKVVGAMNTHLVKNPLTLNFSLNFLGVCFRLDLDQERFR